MSNLNRFIENKLKILENQKYTLILGASPSKNARSPILWNKVYKAKDSKVRMYPADVEKKNIKNLIKYLKKDRLFIGGSVTIPYKVSIMRYLDLIDNKAKKIGSINTILKIKNKLVGLNTDYHGSLSTLKKFKNKKNILVLGCGGAAKAVVVSLLERFKKSKFYFYNRNYFKIKKFTKDLNCLKNNQLIKNTSDLLKLKKLDLIVNTTSVGFNSWMKEKGKLHNLKFFTPISNLKNIKKIRNKKLLKFSKTNKDLINLDKKNIKIFFKNNSKSDVFDIIYNPHITKLMKFANSNRNNINNGLEMNLIQAVKAFMIVNNTNKHNFIKRKMASHG